MPGLLKATLFVCFLGTAIIGIFAVLLAFRPRDVDSVGRKNTIGSFAAEQSAVQHGRIPSDTKISGRTAVITFQRDEDDLILDWTHYYSELFGANRVYIIDHDSTSPTVTNVLSYAVSKGVHVIRHEGEFDTKHKILTSTIHSIFNNVSEVDTVIPLDIDEFIIARDLKAANDFTYTTSHNAIRSHIDLLPRDGFKYKLIQIEAAACNVTQVTLSAPTERRVLSALYFGWPSTGPRHKTFYGRDGFVLTDQGNHYGKVEKESLCQKLANLKTAEDGDGESDFDDLAGTLSFTQDGKDCYHTTPLAVVHYGVLALTFPAWEKKMQRGAEAYGYDEDSNCTASERGAHYCEAIQQIARDPQGAKLQLEATNCWGDKSVVSRTGEPGNGNTSEKMKRSRFYSTFMADAFMGETGTMDFSNSTRFDDSAE